MQAFTDLVSTAVVPAHCIDTDELTDLTPALNTATADDGMGTQASEANFNAAFTGPNFTTCWCDLLMRSPSEE
jgi:hypothetical protein